MTPGQLLLFAVGGLANAAYLFIVAAGLSLVFGALRVINMAHGSFYMIAAFVTVVIANQIGAELGFWAGLLVAVAVTGPLGRNLERVVPPRGHGGGTAAARARDHRGTPGLPGGVRGVIGPHCRAS